MGSRAIEPLITAAFLAGDQGAIEDVDQTVRRVVLDRSIIRVKIWRRDGTIVYSDEPRLIGDRFELGRDEIELFVGAPRVHVEVSDLAAPENKFERHANELVEAYLPITGEGSERLLFEVYFPDSAIGAAANRLWRSFVPWTLGSLIVLQLVQLPLAWSLGRRLEKRQRERATALQQALDASVVERRRIASDLHDGVVQTLAGVALEIGGLARDPALTPALARTLDGTAGELRHGVQGLRSLLVDIYPPNLFAEGLVPALSDLIARVRAQGIDARLEVGRMEGAMSRPVTELAYRMVQESTRNVAAHAQASEVRVSVGTVDHRLRVVVADDGVGFVASNMEPSQGHLGLRGLRDLAASADGSLIVVSQPGEGTRVTLEVPDS